MKEDYISKVDKIQCQWEKQQDGDKTQISNIRLSQQNINYTAKGSQITRHNMALMAICPLGYKYWQAEGEGCGSRIQIQICSNKQLHT